MAEEVKFTEDEMKQLKDLQQGYVNIQNVMGQFSVNRIRLELQLNELNSADDKLKEEFIGAQKKERDFVDSINKKYGNGNLDISTGVFTPKKEEKAPNKS